MDLIEKAYNTGLAEGPEGGGEMPGVSVVLEGLRDVEVRLMEGLRDAKEGM